MGTLRGLNAIDFNPMPTAIKIWEVAGKELRSVPDSALGDNHVEAELESWIATNPEIIGDRILIIDRQRDIPGVGRLDLLGIDQDGALIIIELKRDRTPREAVAQAQDYASWLDSANSDEIIGYAEAYLKKPLAEVFSEYPS
jgi:RecB family endonuclease NucS